MNLLDGTKDFSGTWVGYALTDGTYKGLTVKKMTGQWNDGIRKIFTAPKDGIYTFSSYVKSSGDNAGIYRIITKNGVHVVPDKLLGSNFDWSRDSFSVTLATGDNIYVRYQISGSGSIPVLWNAGHKWEPGSTATPYMPSVSEVTTADYPSYIGTYTGKIADGQSTDPVRYNWKKI